MIKQYFEEDLQILMNCFDLGFHQVCLSLVTLFKSLPQNLKRLANARVDSMDQMIVAQQRAGKSILRHASRLDSK